VVSITYFSRVFGLLLWNISQWLKTVDKACNDLTLQVAFDKIGSMTTNTISKQRKKQEPAVMAELDQRFRRLNSIKVDDK